ncbi:hypothetical protein D3C71_1730980 [compost metagenome]
MQRSLRNPIGRHRNVAEQLTLNTVVGNDAQLRDHFLWLRDIMKNNTRFDQVRIEKRTLLAYKLP